MGFQPFFVQTFKSFLFITMFSYSVFNLNMSKNRYLDRNTTHDKLTWPEISFRSPESGPSIISFQTRKSLPVNLMTFTRFENHPIWKTVEWTRKMLIALFTRHSDFAACPFEYCFFHWNFAEEKPLKKIIKVESFIFIVYSQ